MVQSQPFASMPTIAKTWRAGFDRVGASPYVDTTQFTIVGSVGTGQAVSQTAGSLVMTSGTTVNAETVIRSVENFKGNLNWRTMVTLSQRIVNNNFYVELVDVIGDGLAFTMNSATSVSVTIPNNTFTSANVGQSMYIGLVTGIATPIPGRWSIASVAGNVVTFTVAGWTSTGSGTLSLWGWNYYHMYYTGTTATSTNFDAQRNGWNSGETATAGITTASPGHMAVVGVAGGSAVMADQLSASATALALFRRASRERNIPDDETVLRMQIRMQNGSTAPATTTTFTVGFTEVEQTDYQGMVLTGISPMSVNTGAPVEVINTPTFTLASTSISSLTPGVAAANLGKAEDAVHASGDTGIFVLGVRNDNAATASPTSTNGDYGFFSVDARGVAYMTQAPVSVSGNPTAIVLAANTAQTILAANAARKGAMIVNLSGQPVYLRFGATATLQAFSWQLLQGERYEVPFGIATSISAISLLAGSAVADGVGLYVTEFTA